MHQAQLDPAHCVAAFRLRLETHLDRKDQEGSPGAAIIALDCALSQRSSPRPATAFCLWLDFPEPHTRPGPSQVQHKGGMKGGVLERCLSLTCL